MEPFIDLNVEPIFPTPFASCQLLGDPSLTLDEVSRLDWDMSEGIGAYGYNFLENYPALASQIVEAFSAFKNQYLGMFTVEFVINSSWMTKTSPGATGNNHRHFNSAYTGVYYPFPGEHSPLEISRLGLESSSFLIPAQQQTIFSNYAVYVTPQEGLLIFFPSHVMHKITKNETNEDRYSLAFTLHPCGNLNTQSESSTYLCAKPIGA